MTRSVVLNALKQGISRVRVKGGADPSTLYDLVNGFVTIDGSTQSRPGTRQDVKLPAGTKGLMAFSGGFLVFSHVPTPITGSKYSCEVLVDPNDRALAGAIFGETLRRFHLLSYGCGFILLSTLLARAVLHERLGTIRTAGGLIALGGAALIAAG